MNAKDAIRNTMDMAQMVTQAYLGDLGDADLLVRPVPNSNHIAWQLGHLVASECEMITSLGHRMPELPAGFAAAHNKEAATRDSGFASKQQYLDLMKKVREATLAALAHTPDADFAKPGPESMRSYAPTVGAVFNIIGQHELMHCGQWAIVRRKLNKPVVM